MTKTFTNLECTKKEQQHDLTIRNLECVMEEGQQHDKTFINWGVLRKNNSMT